MTAIEADNLVKIVKKINAAVEEFYEQQGIAHAGSPVGKMIASMKIGFSQNGPFSEEQLEGKKPIYSCLITGNGTPVEMRAWYNPKGNHIDIDYLD